MKSHEERSMIKILLKKIAQEGIQPNQLADYVGHNKKRYSILEKWENKGYWESGVSTRTGYLTEEGFKELGKWGAFFLKSK